MLEWCFPIPSFAFLSYPSLLNQSSTCFSSLKQYLVSGLFLRDVCFLIESALYMSSQEAPMLPPYYPSSPVRCFLPWESGRFPDSFHLECPHEGCAEILAPGHGAEETFAPICPGVQPQATFHYEGSNQEGNPFNFVSYLISFNLVSLFTFYDPSFHDSTTIPTYSPYPLFLRFFLQHTLMGREKTTRRVFEPDGQQGILR